MSEFLGIDLWVWGLIAVPVVGVLWAIIETWWKERYGNRRKQGKYGGVRFKELPDFDCDVRFQPKRELGIAIDCSRKKLCLIGTSQRAFNRDEIESATPVTRCEVWFRANEAWRPGSFSSQHYPGVSGLVALDIRFKPDCQHTGNARIAFFHSTEPELPERYQVAVKTALITQAFAGGAMLCDLGIRSGGNAEVKSLTSQVLELGLRFDGELSNLIERIYKNVDYYEYLMQLVIPLAPTTVPAERITDRSRVDQSLLDLMTIQGLARRYDSSFQAHLVRTIDDMNEPWYVRCHVACLLSRQDSLETKQALARYRNTFLNELRALRCPRCTGVHFRFDLLPGGPWHCASCGSATVNCFEVANTDRLHP